METAGRLRFPAFGAAAALAAFIAVGAIGLRNYGVNYWLYRGFSPPQDPAWVKQQGTQEQFGVVSPALGGRNQSVYVYLPPGYASSQRRYPVVYLLHGFPGRPFAFVQTVRMGVVVDEVVSRNPALGAILVMPYGSTGTFTDKEWANGVGRNQGWETFVARDLVRTIDSRYRTIRAARGRAIAGLSEGGYGAINIGFHHLREFSVIESWSGYMRPDKLRSIYGAHLQKLPANNPVTLLRHVAPELRRRHAFLWFYSGSDDPLRRQNRAFAAQLARYGVAHTYFESMGGHNWGLWRRNAVSAYQAALAHLSHA